MWRTTCDLLLAVFAGRLFCAPARRFNPRTCARRSANPGRRARVDRAMRHPRVILPTAIAVAAACAASATPALAATWTNVPSQAVGSGSALADADALSASSAWAVGGNGDGLIERYDGSAW